MTVSAAPVAIATSTPTGEAIVREGASNNQVRVYCSQCGSANVKPLWLIHSEGSATGKSTTNTVGVGAAGGDIGLVVASSGGRHSQQSLLAGRAAPPQPKETNIVPGRMTGFFGFVLISFFVFSLPKSEGKLAGTLLLIGLIAAGVLGFVVDRVTNDDVAPYNNETFPGVLQQWRESAMCLQCGKISHFPGKFTAPENAG